MNGLPPQTRVKGMGRHNNVVKRENELLRKEVGDLRLQSINKDKEVTEVKRKEDDSWASVATKMKNYCYIYA